MHLLMLNGRSLAPYLLNLLLLRVLGTLNERLNARLREPARRDLILEQNIELGVRATFSFGYHAYIHTRAHMCV